MENQSPVERGDYEGLQLDTRAKDSTKKHLDHSEAPQGLRDPDDSDHEDEYLSEKQATIYMPDGSPNSTTSTTAVIRGNSVPVLADESASSSSEPKVRRTFGLRRRPFGIILGVIIAVIIAAAAIGGAVGGT